MASYEDALLMIFKIQVPSSLTLSSMSSAKSPNLATAFRGFR